MGSTCVPHPSVLGEAGLDDLHQAFLKFLSVMTVRCYLIFCLFTMPSQHFLVKPLYADLKGLPVTGPVVLATEVGQ